MADSEVQWKSHRLRLVDNLDGTYSFATAGGAGGATAANQLSSEGILTTIDTDTGVIAGHAATLAGAVAGTEMQVDIVSGSVSISSGAVTATGSLAVEAATTGGYTPSKQIDIDETEDEVKATAGTVGGWVLTNLHTATVFVKFYNATAVNVTVGTTTPTITIAIPATSGVVMPYGGPGVAFGTAICVAATLGVADADATAIPSANLVVGTIFYK